MPLPNNPVPALPDTLSAYERRLFTRAESALSEIRHRLANMKGQPAADRRTVADQIRVWSNLFLQDVGRIQNARKTKP